MSISTILLPLLSQAESSATTGGTPGQGDMLYWGMMIVMFMFMMWFFMIRPQQAQQRKHDEMIGGLKVGDKIVTIGGIQGSIVNIMKEKDSFQLLVDDKNNVKMIFVLSAVAYVVTDAGKEAETEKK